MRACVYSGAINYAHDTIAPYCLHNFLFHFFDKIAPRLTTELKRQLLQAKVCGTKHEFVRARLCFSYFITRSDSIVILNPFYMHPLSCALITRGPS